MNIVALIPARAGSKGVKNKNIYKIKYKPLISYSIILARKCDLIDEVFVSTDSKKIQEISISYGAKAPFLRPKKSAKDKFTDLEVFKHFIIWYQNEFKKKIDLIVHLRPTTPFRKIKTITKAIKIMQNKKNFDCLRSFSKSEFTPFKMWFKLKDRAIPILKSKNKHSMGRQFLPKSYDHNGYVDIMRVKNTIKKNSMTGKKVYLFELDNKKEYCIDIDTISDMKISKRKTKFFSLKK